MVLGQGLIEGNESVENFPFDWRNSGKLCLQTFLQIFEDERNEANVGDFIFGESLANKFGAQGAQVNDAGSTGKWTEKADHEIDGVIRWQNAEIADAGPEWIERSESDTLFEIIFVGHHAAFGAAAGAGGVDDGGEVFAFAGNELRSGAGIGTFFELGFPAVSASEIGVGRSFGNENGFQICGCFAAEGAAKLTPNGIFGDKNFCAGVLEELPLFGGR